MKNKSKEKVNSPKNDSFSQKTDRNTSPEQIGIAFTAKKTWIFIISIILFLITMLYFGYKDWQRQEQFRIDFEERHFQ